jgi:hypothetical protein
MLKKRTEEKVNISESTVEIAVLFTTTGWQVDTFRASSDRMQLEMKSQHICQQWRTFLNPTNSMQPNPS